jgi:iron complex transport system permease protein
MKKSKTAIIAFITIIIMLAAAIGSLFIGKYPLTIEGIFTLPVQQRVLLRIRLPRTLAALFGGFALGVAGYVFQTIFKNPLASPDVIGVSSGASAGAAFAIVFLGNTAMAITLTAFSGAVIALAFTAVISTLAKKKDRATIVLAGIAVQALAQTLVMFLKMQADPEKHLASIEYWMMGSLSGTSLNDIPQFVILTTICIALFILLYRHVIILSLDDTQAKLLGAHPNISRWLLLLLGTLMVSSVISLTGPISFISLISAHIANLIFKKHNRLLLIEGGVVGATLLIIADCLARLGQSELPVSIYTSLIGVPVLVYLFIIRGRSFKKKGGKQNG